MKNSNLKSLIIGGCLYILFSIANGNRFSVVPIACATAASLVFCCFAVWRYGVRVLEQGAVAWAIFTAAYLLSHYINAAISIFVYHHTANPVGRLTVVSITIIIFAVLVAMLLWRTFSRRDFTDEVNQQEFLHSFKAVTLIMLIFYVAVLIDFMFIRRFASGDRIRQILPIPFETIYKQFFVLDLSAFEVFCQICGNLFLLTPIGFAAKSGIFSQNNAEKAPKRKIRQKSLSPKGRKICFFILPFAITFFFEIMQYAFAVGYSDIDDIILNSAGYFIGAAVPTVLSFIRSKRTNGADKKIL